MHSNIFPYKYIQCVVCTVTIRDVFHMQAYTEMIKFNYNLNKT
jgi:hypothetical protein